MLHYQKLKVISLFYLIVFGYHISCFSAEINSFKSVITIKGVLNSGDDEIFLRTLVNNEATKSVVFSSCLGGSLQAGFKISQLIKRKKLNTVAKDECHSSCAYAFLAGAKRTFDPSIGSHFLGIHATTATNGTYEEQEERNRALIRYLSYLLDYKLPEKIKSLIFESRGVGKGVVFIAKNSMFGNSELETRYCNGTENKNIKKCQKIENIDVISIGIIKPND